MKTCLKLIYENNIPTFNNGLLKLNIMSWLTNWNNRN